MTSFQDSLRSELRNQLCLWLATQENLYRIGARLVPLLEIGSELYGAGYRFFCNREPPTYTPPAPPFTGGQCPGVLYKVGVVCVYTPVGGGSNVTVGDFARNVVGAVVGGYAEFRTPGSPTLLTIGCRGAGGQDIVLFSLGADAVVSVSTVAITREDGAPDTCGDPPGGTTPPPSSSTGSTNITYNDNTGTSVTVPINFVFGLAFVDANLNLNIPIRVSFNNSFNPSFNATANLSTGDINFNFGNTNIIHPPDGTTTPPDGFGTDGDPPEQPTDTPGDPVIPPADTPEDDTTRIISGVIVTATDIYENISEVFQDDNPNIYIPRLGNVQFLIQVGRKVAWTTDIPIRNRRHFIPCPWEGGAIDVRATPVPNVEISLTKVYKLSQEAVAYIA